MIAIIAIVSILLIPQVRKKESLQDAFGDYYSFLTEGDEQLRAELGEAEHDWLVFEVSQSVFTQSEREQYYKNLSQKYNDVIEITNEKYHGTELSEQVNSYHLALNTVLASLGMSSISKQVLLQYMNGGDSAAQDYVSEVVASFESPSASNAYTFLGDMLKSYFEIELQRLQIYDLIRCFDEDGPDISCGQEIIARNTSYNATMRARENYYLSIDKTTSQIRSDFMKMTNQLKESIDEKNDE